MSITEPTYLPGETLPGPKLQEMYKHWTSYTVLWTAPGGSAPSIGNGTLIGNHQRSGLSCHVNIWLNWGSTTSGGTTEWYFSLPFTAAAGVGEQFLVGKAFTAGGLNWLGFGLIPSSGTTIRPFFPSNATTSSVAQARNADISGATGTGVPNIPASFTWATAGHNLIISGTYKIA